MRFFFKILFNKYLLATAAFIVWVGFFDTNDYGSQQARNGELNLINADIDRLNSEIARLEEEHHLLLTNPAALERYAREHYRMKRDTEDIYVITP